MKFAEQLESSLCLNVNKLVSVEPYLLKEMPDGFTSILGYLGKAGEHEDMDCCVHHRTKLLMRIWCAGATVAIQLYQMYGEAEDLRELLTEVKPPAGEEDHDD